MIQRDPSIDEDILVRRNGRNWKLTARMWLPLQPEEVFPFFSDAGNLERITPELLQFHVVTPLPIEMRDGALIDYRLKVHGFPIRWRTRIESWDPPRQFVDTQLRGPYALWYHKHRFMPADGGTLCVDEVDYRPRGGPLASLINRLFVQKDVTAIFHYRQRVIREILVGEAAPAVEAAPC